MLTKQSLTIIILLVQSSIIAYIGANFLSSKIDLAQLNKYSDSHEKSLDPVNVCILHKSKFIGNIITYGKVKSSYSTVIQTPVISGYKIIVDQIFTKTGQKVLKGDEIVKFKCDELAFKLESSKKDYEQQNEYMCRVDKAKFHVSDYDYRKSKLQLEKYLAEYSSIKAHYDSLVVKSPFNGIIGMIGLVEGESITSERPITQIVNDEILDVEFFLGIAEAEQLNVGYDIMIETIDGEYAISANITDINPYLDEQISKVKVKARLNSMETDVKIFKHNLNVNVVIDKLPVEDVYVVPRTAIVDTISSNYVCKLERKQDSGLYETKLIKINIIDYKGEQVAFNSPTLLDGDYVVYEGYTKKDGINVSIKEIID